MPKLFCYGTLNVHSVQRGLWSEPKDGVRGALFDFELKMWPESWIFYVEPKPGECVVGKIYELTDEQLTATDSYETAAYKRVEVDDPKQGKFFVFVKN